MKSLFLSSYLFGNCPDELRALVRPGARGAIILNALDEFGARLPEQVESHVRGLAGLGIDAQELDLREFFGHPDRLRSAMHDYGLVWAVGGNSFVLRRAMRASGLDEVARDRVLDGSLVWAGFSAGAVVATPTLRGLDRIDDPNTIPDGYENLEAVWDGLALVDYSIAPHYQSPHADSEVIEGVVRYFESAGMPFRALRDGEAIVIRGTDERIVR